jgi:hypothetical protein
MIRDAVAMASCGHLQIRFQNITIKDCAGAAAAGVFLRVYGAALMGREEGGPPPLMGGGGLA